MFEDSTFESTGRIRTRSRGWMMAAFTINGSVLLVLILIPLIYPEALPRQMMNMLLEAPPPPAADPPPQPKRPVTQARIAPEVQDGHIFAPSRIPMDIAQITRLEPAPGGEIAGLDQGLSQAGVPGSLLTQSAPAPIVRLETRGPVHLSSGVVAGLLLHKTAPVYPSIALAMRLEGTVVVQASISKTGTIENLRVVSGPAILQQAALDAVRNWRYRPYLLNGEPVEVETTVNVIFSMGH